MTKWKLKKIHLFNFKIHKEKTFNFKDGFNSIVGANAQGKTSILEAIQFLFHGGKKDKDKITVGTHEMRVTAVFVDALKRELSITSGITNGDVVKYKAPVIRIDGVKQSSPSSFLKNMLEIESFNLRALLEPKGREDRILSLIPSRVTLNQIVGLAKDTFIKSLDLNQHAFKVLMLIGTHLKEEATFLWRTMKQKEKAFIDYEEKLNKEKVDLPVGSKDFSDLIEDEKVLIAEEARQAQIIKKIREEQEEREKQKDKNIKIFLGQERVYQETEKELKELNLKIKELTKKKEICKKRREEGVLINEDLKAMIRQQGELLESHVFTIKEVQEKLLTLQTHKEEAKRLETFKEHQDYLKTLEKELDNSKKDHGAVKKKIKEDLLSLKHKLLKPIAQQLPGLDIDTDGNMKLNGISIDELSESESLRFALRLFQLKNPGGLLCIDGGEVFDVDTLIKMDWKDLQVIMTRVENKDNLFQII